MARPVGRDFSTAILVAMWNYMGWDNATTVANEVENPQRNYPRVILLAVVDDHDDVCHSDCRGGVGGDSWPAAFRPVHGWMRRMCWAARCWHLRWWLPA